MLAGPRLVAASVRLGLLSAAGFFSSSALASRAICDSGAWNSPAARVGSALSAPASLASSTSRDSRSAILADLVGGERLAVEHTALDDQQRVGPGEVTQALGGLDRVALDERDRGRAGEQAVVDRDAGVGGRALGQGVLDDRVGRVRTQRPAQLGDLLDGQARGTR